MDHTYRSQSPVVRYGVATLIFCGLTALSFLWPPLRAFLIIPIILASWVGGLIPGLVFAVLTVIGYSVILYGQPSLDATFLFQTISLMIVAVLTDQLYKSMTQTKQQATQLETILNSINDAVIFIDNQQQISYMNPHARTFFGTQAKAQQLPYPLHNVYQLARRHDKPYAIDQTTLKAATIEGEAAPLPNGVVITFRDITDKHEAQLQLKQSENNFKTALEGSPVLVCHQDKHLRYTWIYNAQLYDPDDIIGQSDYDLLDDDESRRTVIALKQSVLNSGEPRREEITIYEADGTRRDYLIYVRPTEFGIMTTLINITERKQIEEENLRNAKRLQAAVQNAPLTIVELDRDLRYVWVAGLPDYIDKDDIIGQKQAAYFDRDSHHTPIREAEQRVMKTGQPERLVGSFHKSDGTHTTWDRTILPRTNADGEIVGVTVAAVDITNLREAENQLRESEERLQTAIKNSPLTVITFDTDLCYQWVANPHPAFDAEAALGKHIKDVMPDEQGQQLADVMQEVMDTQTGKRTQLTFALPDADTPMTWDTTFEPVYDAQGHVKGLTVAGMDITERVELMQTVATERDKLKTVIDNISEEIWFCDAKGEFYLINQAVHNFFELPKVTDANLTSLLEQLEVYNVDGTRRSIEDAPLQRALQGERITNEEEKLIHPHTNEVHYRQYSVVPLYDAFGNIYGAVCTVRDITDQKLMQVHRASLLKKEREARIAAEQADAVKTEFLAVVTHELRTPLTAIAGFTETLLAEDVTWSTTETHDFLLTIADEANKLETLVADLLDISRMQSGSFIVESRPNSVPALMTKAEPTLKRLTQNHTLSIELPPDLPPIMADDFRLIQVLTNLVSNAAKFTTPGTAITITATAREKIVQINVCDEGPGIEAEDREHIFDAFHRSKSKPGVGLGLAICKGIVEAHDGVIWVEYTSPQRGTCIAFTLPIGT